MNGFEHERRSDDVNLQQFGIHLLAEFKRAVEEDRQKLLEAIGFDITTPEKRAEIHRDHEFIRNLRLGSDKAKSTVGVVGVTALASGALWFLWDAIKYAVKGSN